MDRYIYLVLFYANNSIIWWCYYILFLCLSDGVAFGGKSNTKPPTRLLFTSNNKLVISRITRCFTTQTNSAFDFVLVLFDCSLSGYRRILLTCHSEPLGEESLTRFCPTNILDLGLVPSQTPHQIFFLFYCEEMREPVLSVSACVEQDEQDNTTTAPFQIFDSVIHWIRKKNNAD